MECTSCKKGQLCPAYLDAALPCHTCNHCGGHWLYLNDYLRWLEQNENAEFVMNMAAAVKADESREAMLCPRTGGVMLKYRISKDTDHRLDLSPTINGIWMDKGEWELLKVEGLAGKLNEVFTYPWQRKIKQGRARDVLEQMYIEEFGDVDYEKLKEFRKWLQYKKRRQAMLAFLMDEDPYSV